MKKILIIGGSSFLGYHFDNYVRDKYKLTSTYLSNKPLSGNFVRCNILSKADIHSLGEFDVVVHYSSIVAGDNKLNKNISMVKNVINYCNSISAKYIYISSSQVHFEVDSTYKQSKIESEIMIKDLSSSYIIIRPAAPYGNNFQYNFTRQQSFHVLTETIIKSPLIPVIGNGKYFRQPLNVLNLNQLLTKTIDSDIKNKTFEIGGPDQLTFNTIIDVISKNKIGKLRLKLHLPKFIFTIASIFFNFIDSELVNAVTSNESVNNESWRKYFEDISLISFNNGVNDL